MKYTELVPGVRSSVIGFGCGPMLGSVDKSSSTRALEVAFYEGVVHFDLAPSYGYGEAESFFGEFAKNRRDKLFIATKFGIEASPLAQLARPLKPLARTILRSLKKTSHQTSASGVSAAPPASNGASRMLKKVEIEPQAMARSVERSLKRLKTDHLDLLMLHEPEQAISDFKAVLEMAKKLKAEGKILSFGLAAMIQDFEVHRDFLADFDVIQTNAPLDQAEHNRILAIPPNQGIILFSPFRSHQAKANSGEKQFTLTKLNSDFPKAVTLCSMFSGKHIILNCKAVK